MHSASYRTNAILTMAFSGLVALCVAVSLTEVFHRSSPEASLKLHHVHYFRPSLVNNDEVSDWLMMSDRGKAWKERRGLTEGRSIPFSFPFYRRPRGAAANRRSCHST